MPVHLAKLGMSRSKLDHKLFMNEQRLSLLALPVPCFWSGWLRVSLHAT